MFHNNLFISIFIHLLIHLYIEKILFLFILSFGYLFVHGFKLSLVTSDVIIFVIS